MMAGLQASLRSLTVTSIGELSELFAKLNLLVYDASPSNRFATFFFGAYDPATRRLRYATAGHDPALLYRAASGTVEFLRAPGIGLGLRRISIYSQAGVTFEAGDVLVLYTDGVTEARNLDQEEFGEERLVAALRASADRSAEDALAHITAAVRSFALSAPQHDDITLIVARAL